MRKSPINSLPSTWTMDRFVDMHNCCDRRTH